MTGRPHPRTASRAARAPAQPDRALPAEAVLVSLVNDLDELAGPTVLALDDYHVIDAPDIHEAVTFLLDHFPPQVTIAITSAHIAVAERPRGITFTWPALTRWPEARKG